MRAAGCVERAAGSVAPSLRRLPPSRLRDGLSSQPDTHVRGGLVSVCGWQYGAAASTPGVGRRLEKSDQPTCICTCVMLCPPPARQTLMHTDPPTSALPFQRPVSFAAHSAVGARLLRTSVDPTQSSIARAQLPQYAGHCQHLPCAPTSPHPNLLRRWTSCSHPMPTRGENLQRARIFARSSYGGRGGSAQPFQRALLQLLLGAPPGSGMNASASFASMFALSANTAFSTATFALPAA